MRLRLGCCLLVAVFCLAIISSFSSALAQGDDLAAIEGYVVEDLTGAPMVNATVTVWSDGGKLKATTGTDDTGYYRIGTEGGLNSRIYVFHDDPTTPGVDYVPAFRSFYLPEASEVNFTFTLTPAASIILDGDLLFVESTKSPSRVEFTVIDPATGAPMSGDNRVHVYGTDPTAHSRFLDLTDSHIILPADVTVNILVNSTVSVDDAWVYRTFIIDDADTLTLNKGRLVHADVRKHSSQFNLDLVTALVSDVEKHLDETEQTGFYVTVELRDLTTIDELMEAAEGAFAQERYGACHADLREAYISVEILNNRLGTMHAEAAISVLILIFFFAFTALALASLFLERGSHKAVATCALYVVLLFLLHRTYPGVGVVESPLFLTTAVAALAVALIFAFVLPYFIRERATEGRIVFRSAVAAVFSMAKRNLRRRKLRFALTLITVTVLVMSFIALTSFSTGYGLVAKSFHTATPPSEGLLIRKPHPASSLTSSSDVIPTFTPLSVVDVTWAHGKSETTLVAPKTENIPAHDSLGNLALKDNPASFMELFGLVGVLPSAEDRVTNIGRIVIDGRFLGDNEENAVLISIKAADTLNAHPGDTLLFSLDSFQIEVDLVGIFADTLFNQLIDLDGKPLTPDKVVLLSEGSDEELPTYAVVSCEPSEIIITTWQAAYNFGGVAVSRIDVHLEGDQDVLATARRMALERDYWVWSATAGQVNLTKLESYFEAKGFSVLIPWIIVIFTVVATMLNAIFERRREIAILSSIGLNPSHITALFVAEATIIGFIGGGVGYLSGLGMYRLMSRLSITLAVRQKVSAVWCVGALGIAAVAVVTGAVVALRSSVIVTPSLLRKWKADEKPSTAREPWVFTLPIKVRPTEINAFLTYVKRCLERYAVEVDAQRIGRLKQTEEEMPQGVTKRIHFNYYYGEGSADRFFTVNQLVATKRTDGEVYTLTLSSRGAESWTYKTASFVRAFILTWSAMKK